MKKFPVTLLYVENDIVLQNIYKHILENVIEKIFYARNGEEGYNIFEEKHPDLIITDIRMPVMNGLDMIRKIKRKNPKIRVIILSAYGESRYFLQAIELGVKGFLLKPADTTKLVSLVNEQIDEIRLEWKLQQEEEKRRKAEQARLKSETILRALVNAGASFFHYGFNSISIMPAFEGIGKATESSRVYIFQNETKNSETFTSQIYEWTANDIEPQINNPNLQNIPLSQDFLYEWVETMEKRQNIVGLVKKFKHTTLKKFLKQQDIISILIIPIFVNEEWWGFVGLDDCKKERVWSEAEIRALEALANNLGAAIYRRNVEIELLRLNASLEERVQKRTRDLEIEVAERKMTELLLRDSEEKYRLIFENANSSIILIREGIIILVNPKTVETFGYLPKYMIGKHLSHFIDSNFQNKIINCFEKNNFDENCNSIDVRIITKTGNPKWVEIKSNEIVWDNKDSYLIFISDINARKIAEKSLNELNKSLEERIREKVEHLKQQQQLLMQKSKLESMGELSAGLAHEINQPLVGISLGLDNIQMRLTNKDEVDKQYIQNKLKFLFSDIERINQIIQHVRLFSREQEFSIEDDVDVNEVISNALSLMKMQLKNHYIEINIQLSEKPLIIKGNQYRFEQVLVNLLSNAKYAVERKEKNSNNANYKKHITIKSFRHNNTAHVLIQDNGIGIDKNIINNIFNPFFTTKNEKQGTGLGLSISYGIVREMKGNIYVESELNKKTTFTVELPIS